MFYQFESAVYALYSRLKGSSASGISAGHVPLAFFCCAAFASPFSGANPVGTVKMDPSTSIIRRSYETNSYEVHRVMSNRKVRHNVTLQ
jgi:hypothetical protein